MTSKFVLMLDHGAPLRDAVASFLKGTEHRLALSHSLDEARHLLHRNPDVVIVEDSLTSPLGLNLVPEIRTHAPRARIITLARRESQVEAVDVGTDQVGVEHIAIGDVAECMQRVLSEPVPGHHDDDGTSRILPEEMLGESGAMADLQSQIPRVAHSDATTLIVGETGTGKELVARAIQRHSPRRHHPLITVNCSALPRELLESEMFGHVKGAYTGAIESRAGVFEMANGGTLFLDEIGDMDVGLQAKVLRVLEGHAFRRVGGRDELHTDVRILAATHQDLKAAMHDGRFREDLYYRLNVFTLRVPPLRERDADIMRLAEHFCDRAQAKVRKRGIRFADPAKRILERYAWPGNVRELRNVVERAVILCDGGEIGLQHLPNDVKSSVIAPGAMPREIRSKPNARKPGSDSNLLRQPDSVPNPNGSGHPTLDEIEINYIIQVFESTGGNLAETARILGVARNTVKRRLRAKGLLA